MPNLQIVGLNSGDFPKLNSYYPKRIEGLEMREGSAPKALVSLYFYYRKNSKFV